MSDKTEWQHIAIKKATYEKLKGRAAGISVSIEQLLQLEEKEIARRLAKGKSELLHHISGWATGMAVSGHIVTLRGLPTPNAQGYLEVHVHAEFKEGHMHDILFTHVGHSLAINCSTFAEHHRTIVIPIHTVGADKE